MPGHGAGIECLSSFSQNIPAAGKANFEDGIG